MSEDMTMRALLEARALMQDVTPLKSDCGRICGAACCEPDETGRGGMLLFPMEERLYEGKKGFVITKDVPGGLPALLLTCDGHCERADRPLSCRIFPLLPKKSGGRVRAVRDRRGFIVCPLLPDGLAAFDPDFISAVVRAGECLYRAPQHERFLDALHQQIDAYRNILTG